MTKTRFWLSTTAWLLVSGGLAWSPCLTAAGMSSGSGGGPAGNGQGSGWGSGNQYANPWNPRPWEGSGPRGGMPNPFYGNQTDGGHGGNQNEQGSGGGWGGQPQPGAYPGAGMRPPWGGGYYPPGGMGMRPPWGQAPPEQQVPGRDSAQTGQSGQGSEGGYGRGYSSYYGPPAYPPGRTQQGTEARPSRGGTPPSHYPDSGGYYRHYQYHYDSRSGATESDNTRQWSSGSSPTYGQPPGWGGAQPSSGEQSGGGFGGQPGGMAMPGQPMPGWGSYPQAGDSGSPPGWNTPPSDHGGMGSPGWGGNQAREGGPQPPPWGGESSENRARSGSGQVGQTGAPIYPSSGMSYPAPGRSGENWGSGSGMGYPGHTNPSDGGRQYHRQSSESPGGQRGGYRTGNTQSNPAPSSGMGYPMGAMGYPGGNSSSSHTPQGGYGGQAGGNNDFSNAMPSYPAYPGMSGNQPSPQAQTGGASPSGSGAPAPSTPSYPSAGPMGMPTFGGESAEPAPPESGEVEKPENERGDKSEGQG